jgi:hypothetical protein
MLPDVLRGEEDTEGQPIQEVSGGEQTRNRTQTESGLSLQELGDVLSLRHTSVAVAAVSTHEGEGVKVLAAGVFLVEVRKAVIHSAPEEE